MPESLFKKVAGLRSAALLKKEALAQAFFCEFGNILKNTNVIELLQMTASVIPAENVIAISFTNSF